MSYDTTGIGDIDLAQFDDDYSNAPVEEHEFDEVPDGKYQVNVEKVELTKAQSSGNPMLKWTLKILGPQYAGRLLWRNSVITKATLSWLKTDLSTCGLEIGSLSELSGRLGDLLDIKLEVTKKTKGENQNIYFNRRIVLDDLEARDDDSLAPF
ncbi:MAG: DUF669 domain-containing protein [Bacteroidales bacterium]|nr:DUF669 domain-containing protein [Bacteroidales bacterium]